MAQQSDTTAALEAVAAAAVATQATKTAKQK